GVATPDIGYSRANTVAIDAQGRIVAAGYDAIGPDFNMRGFAVARFLADVAPQITSLAVDQSAVTEGQTVTLTGTANNDLLFINVEWGDSSGTQQVSPGQDRRSFSVSHTYYRYSNDVAARRNPSGVFTVTALATDVDHLQAASATTVTVNPAPLNS